jgi:hypothetical protein
MELMVNKVLAANKVQLALQANKAHKAKLGNEELLAHKVHKANKAPQVEMELMVLKALKAHKASEANKARKVRKDFKA